MKAQVVVGDDRRLGRIEWSTGSPHHASLLGFIIVLTMHELSVDAVNNRSQEDVCMYVCMYVCKYVYVCMYVSMYMYVYI